MLLPFTGEYSGWVWVIPASNYDTTEPLPSWPPVTEGPAAVAKKWFGSLKAGRIFLARQTTLEDSDVLPVVDIPLSGCTVRLVTEGLTGQTAHIASSSSPLPQHHESVKRPGQIQLSCLTCLSTCHSSVAMVLGRAREIGQE